jgi:hypothetical protein
MFAPHLKRTVVEKALAESVTRSARAGSSGKLLERRNASA